jgi:hypothetical protein
MVTTGWPKHVVGYADYNIIILRVFTYILVISHNKSSVHGHESFKSNVCHSFKAQGKVQLLQRTRISYSPAECRIYVFHMNLTINCECFLQQL